MGKCTAWPVSEEFTGESCFVCPRRVGTIATAFAEFQQRPVETAAGGAGLDDRPNDTLGCLLNGGKEAGVGRQNYTKLGN